MKSVIKTVLNSEKKYPVLTALAAGLYPFLHYFNSNLHIANSWEQLGFMILLCFGIPLILVWLSKVVLKITFLKRFESQRLAIINLAVFFTLIGFLIFNFKKKATVMVILLACVLACLVYKHLKKIIILQLLLAVMSIATLVPLLSFALQQNNGDWAPVSEAVLGTKFQTKPNIFVIQPDGYVNRTELEKPPYSCDNSEFYHYLETQGFTNYDNFRSNYFSTLTSNASMFAMKHHKYSNTYTKGHKTFNANKVIIGNQNNVLKILQQNSYATHLITDNSYFTIDRVEMAYDYHNVATKDISFIKSGTIPTDIISDLETVLDTLNRPNNFFFIEKISPSHIVRTSSISKGVEGERDAYIERLESANSWLKDVIKRINSFDDDALIIIVADHGGFVGLNNTLESVRQPMNEKEIMSVFSAILSIKWPNQLSDNDLKFQSNVNLFRTVFYGLSGNQKLIEPEEDNSSYIPYYESGRAVYYECISNDGQVILYGNRN